MGELREVRLPDIGDFEDVDVVEVLVAPGDRIAAEDSLIVLESDKATMEIPCPWGGLVKELRVAVGDRVSEGSLIAVLELEEAAQGTRPVPTRPSGLAEPATPPEASPTPVPEPAPRDPSPTSPPAPVPARDESGVRPGPAAHASPSVRRLARELGVDLARVAPTGPKGRVLRGDVQAFVKAMLTGCAAPSGPGTGVAPASPPGTDVEKFGPSELQPLPRIRKLSAGNLQRSWGSVPHVTQFDTADVTELDAFRRGQKGEAERRGFKLTFLPFVVKACAAALREFPHLNASLDRTGENLIVKKYVHIGVAVDTEHGLVVPVIRDADRKGLFALAQEVQELGGRARARRLRPEDLQGASFSISSLGGIGGTFFTPIVNHPEVAILGVSRMEWKPVFRDGEFVPRLTLPLSLSYDHRVVDGAEAVRFTTRLGQLLSDLRLLLL